MRRFLAVALTVAIAALVIVPATYACLRGYDALFRHEANPATVIWSAKIAMFWRLKVAAYLAGMISWGVAVAARRDLDKTLRVLYVALHIAAAAIVVQGLVLP